MTKALPQQEVLRHAHEFLRRAVSQKLGHAVPFADTLPADDTTLLVQWLNLLDLAITAPMMRDALREQTSPTTAASLLRYYICKQTRSDTDRDKTDFIVTRLFRSPDPPDQWDARGVYFSGGKTYTQFEPFLVQMLGLPPAPELPVEHQQLIREFDYLAEEVEDYRHFDAMIDSGVMQRIRDVKQSFGVSFFHPHVLAIMAAYNVFFGVRFDRLFHEATQQIKNFAQKVQSEGGSIMTRLEGDVIVKQLADVKEEEILQTDYGKAQDEFRQLSRFKKAVDHRRGVKEAAAAAAATAAIKRPTAIMPPSPIELNGLLDGSSSTATPAESSPSLSLEESKLNDMTATIRTFVRAADPKSAQLVPVRFGSLALTPPEADAFRADYSREKSFRADYVNVLVSIVSIIGRMGAELADFKAKRSSAYMWKPHADSLSQLLSLGRDINSRAMTVAELAERRGLADKMNAINASLAKLREQVQIVAETLQTLGTSSRDSY